jgi:cystathionine beta-lyase/cystathionine gamma-synthase
LRCTPGAVTGPDNRGLANTDLPDDDVYAGSGRRRQGLHIQPCGKPNVSALERRLAALEGAEYATCFSTGLAATTALFLGLLKAGDRVIVSEAVYGGTVRLLREILGPFGVIADFVDTSNADAFRTALEREATKIVFIETPANPTLKLTDIRARRRTFTQREGPCSLSTTRF